MSREKKKGTSGNAKAFITRAKALKKLQLTLPEFRRLSILKGIYPRDPRKKLHGHDKTYYLSKDIDFLAHERLITTLRQQNAHQKKVVNARAKRRVDLLKRLALSTPKARLDHLVVERFPHFTDAIRELDDPLCIVALFANLPADRKVGIPPARVANCQRLLKEFHHFVAHTNALRRVFVSIKGYYFQASLCGETVTWLAPHRFTQILPADVDYSVMLTFLELYECIMSFVNFRLYTSRNLAYPPSIIRIADANGLELASVQTTKRENPAAPKDDAPPALSDEAMKAAENAALTNVEDESDDDEKPQQERDDARPTEDAKDGEPEDDQEENENLSTAIFAGKSVVLGREVPYLELEFALKATGAEKVTREGDLPVDGSLDDYTHWIVDRPKIVGERNMLLEYVQPQYVFDSINAAVLLPTALYAPGANLPPHLSPFVTEDDDGGYRPWFKDVLERIKAGDTSVVAEAAAVVYAEGEAKAKQARDAMERSKESTKVKSKQKSSKDDAKEPERRSETANGTDPTEGDMSEMDDAVEKDEKDNEKAAADEGAESAEDPSVESSSEEGGSEDGERRDEEEDEEGEEAQLSKSLQETTDKEGKEMATLMLSRKKMRQYRREKHEERKNDAVRRKLTEKRKKLDEEREQSITPKATKKRRK